jgi:hypothetical protein
VAQVTIAESREMTEIDERVCMYILEDDRERWQCKREASGTMTIQLPNSIVQATFCPYHLGVMCGEIMQHTFWY